MITSSSSSTIHAVVEQFVREELSPENAQIAGAVWAMLDAGGKELRPRITMLASEATNERAPQDPILASYMELIHVATLIHDDVVDNARLRRGKDSTNSVHGNRFSVLAGDYLFSWVFKKITQSYDNPVPTILAAMLSEICSGEVKQLRAAGNLSLSRDQYFEIIAKKTAALFAACAEVGSIVAFQRASGISGPPVRDQRIVKALRGFGWAFGMAFQIRDDVLDVTASERALGKPAGSDLRERKVTLPLIIALDADDGMLRASVAKLFSEDPGLESDTLANVIGHLRSSGAVTQAKEIVAEYAGRARTALADLVPSKAVAELEALTGHLGEYSS